MARARKAFSAMRGRTVYAPAASVHGLSHDDIVRRHAGGGLDAARRDRLTDSWTPGGLSPRQIHRSMGFVRDRVRDLLYNNPFAQGGIDAYCSNAIECGITPKSKVKEAARDILLEYDYWAENEADITGQSTLTELQLLWLEEVLVGGGCLVRYITLPRSLMQGRRLPLAIEVIPEERFADDETGGKGQRKDSRGAMQMPGTVIINGVEVHKQTGRVVAFWLHDTLPEDAYALDRYETVRVPNDPQTCHYAFRKRRAGQYRGLTMFLPVVMWLWKIGYYTDNEMMTAAIRSLWVGMIETDPAAEWVGLSDDDIATAAADEWGNPLEGMAPGTFFRGYPGDKIQWTGPATQASDSVAWLEFIERVIGVGMGLSRSEMMRTTGKSSFSAVRAERQSDHRRYRMTQKFCISHMVRPTYRAFMAAAVLAGRPGFPSLTEYANNRDEWDSARYQKPGWASVTPKDDAIADDTRLKNRTITRAAIVEREGGDVDEVFEQIDREEKELDRLGLLPQATEPDAGMDDEDERDEDEQHTGSRDDDADQE